MRNLRDFLREGSDEYSTKGHAGMKVKANDPRFADNAMADASELDEFDATGGTSEATLDRLHQMFIAGKISDQEIKQGIELTDAALHRAAAALGVGPKEVKMLLASLTQHLRDAAEETEESNLAESYRQFMEASDTGPFESSADDLSAEGDYLGNLTVRAANSGKSRFYQGSQAAHIKNQLDSAAPDEQQAILRPLVEDGYAAEIANDAGSYNFPWKLADRSGFGTALYNTAGGKPDLHLISVREMNGDDVQMDVNMHKQLLDQARAFIPDA